jgi:hypothetical protein
MTKPATAWTPPSGQGYVIRLGNIFLVDNTGNFLVDNSKNFLATNTTYNIPKNATVWTASEI